MDCPDESFIEVAAIMKLQAIIAKGGTVSDSLLVPNHDAKRQRPHYERVALAIGDAQSDKARAGQTGFQPLRPKYVPV